MSRNAGKKPSPLIKSTSQKIGIIEKNQRIILFCIFIVSLVSRLPLIWNNLPPYQFCDETIYFEEVMRMILTGDTLPNEYRAGGFNLYPALFLINTLNFLLPVPLSYSQSLIAGKFLYVALLPSLSVFYVYKISRLFSVVKISLAVSLLYSFSVFYYMPFWYPDTFIQFNIVGFLFYFLLILNRHFQSRNFILLGLFLAFAVSTKWTAVLLFLPLLLAIGLSLRKWTQTRESLFGLGCLAISFSIAFLSLNAGILLRTDKFLEGFKFNLNNYGTTEGIRFSGFSYYLSVTLWNSFGMLVMFFIIFGVIWAVKKRSTALVILIFPLALIAALGDKQYVVPRHMASAAPFLIPFLAIGFERFRCSEKFRRNFRIFLITFVLAFSSLSYASQVVVALQADTRTVAEEWVHKNISNDVIVGTNEFCFGASPAQVVGRETVNDPNMMLNLDYYLFSSFWPCPATSKYLSRGALTSLDQSKLHFEQWNSTRLFGPIKSPSIVSSDFKKGYILVKTFRGNGPDIFVVQKL
jgi:hypothetical protein